MPMIIIGGNKRKSCNTFFCDLLPDSFLSFNLKLLRGFARISRLDANEAISDSLLLLSGLS